MTKLAINGGTPVRARSYTTWPQYDEKELKALERVLKSGTWGTLGRETIKFAERFARYHQANYGIAVTNGTITLEIILRAMGIGYGDEVIIPPYTFNATASSVVFAGATPVFADIECDSYNLDAKKLDEAISPKTKAVIPVHIGGRPCNMDGIVDIARRYNLYVIEDCAHAHGSEWKGKRVGSMGDAGSFSFQNSKNLTAGEGGLITLNDALLYEKCWSIHHCGRDMKGLVWYGHPNIGTNARMTEWQAAILDSQMDRLDGQIDKRMENAAYLNSRLKEISCIAIMKPDPRVTRNTYHLFIFRFKSEECRGLSREMFIKALNAEGIPCSSGYSCLYKQPYFSGEDFRRITGSRIQYEDIYLENAETAAAEEGVWFAQNMLLGDKKDIDDMADAVGKIYDNAKELL